MSKSVKVHCFSDDSAVFSFFTLRKRWLSQRDAQRGMHTADENARSIEREAMWSHGRDSARCRNLSRSFHRRPHCLFGGSFLG